MMWAAIVETIRDFSLPPAKDCRNFSGWSIKYGKESNLNKKGK